MEKNLNSLYIHSMDSEGRGVGRNPEGKTIFVNGAIVGEEVIYDSYRRKPSFEEANLVKILKPSPYRVDPICEYFGICGGCSMQHISIDAQVAIKQRILEDSLKRIGKVDPALRLAPILSKSSAYRHKSRLSVRYVSKKQKVLVGFRERKGSYVCDMRSCKVLSSDISDMLSPLSQLIESLRSFDKIAQIEVSAGANHTIYILRNLEPLDKEDLLKLSEFQSRYQPRVKLWLQPNNTDPSPIEKFLENTAEPDLQLYYQLPEFGLKLYFHPNQFTQINPFINELMVSRAIKMLDLNPQDRVLDLFCGLGNFTLPIAKYCSVFGIEGNDKLIKQAYLNAKLNGIRNVKFFSADLSKYPYPQIVAKFGRFDKLLIDPPRSGAFELCKSLENSNDNPKLIVYVSCNPATLARDAGILVHQKNYKLLSSGLVNMFAYTSHLESITLFSKP